MDGRILPEPFQVAYEMLWTRAYSDGGVGAGTAGHPLDGRKGRVGVANGKVERWRVNSGKKDAVAGSVGPKQKTVGKTSRTLRDERAFRFKQKIDKDLRRLAAKIRAFEEGSRLENAGQRVCAGRCGRFGELEWTYCANCGSPMRDLERDE